MHWHKLQQVLFASILRIMKKKIKLNKRYLINIKSFGTARKILNKGGKNPLKMNPAATLKNHVVPHSSQYEAFAHYRVSREVPCFVIKFEMLLGTLDATLTVPQYTGLTPREHRSSWHHFIWAPSPLLITAGRSIHLLCLEGVPDLHGAPQDEASLTKKFET